MVQVVQQLLSHDLTTENAVVVQTMSLGVGRSPTWEGGEEIYFFQIDFVVILRGIRTKLWLQRGCV